MSSPMALIAPLLLAAAAPEAAEPALTADAAGEGESWSVEWSLAPLPLPMAPLAATEGRGIWDRVTEAFRPEPAEQVRIEQRVIIRITPLAPQRFPRQQMLADLPRAPFASKFHERKVGKCVPVAGIAGVQIGGDDRLLLFMRDQRLIGANLDKACRSRDFYSGFYVDRTSDGRLCVDRDMIRSRSGATCSLSKLRLLVADEDD